MDFNLDEDQIMLGNTVTRYLQDRHSFEKRRQLLSGGKGCDADVWRDFAGTLGILGAPLPEECGGLGGGPQDIMVIMEALGRALVVEPYLETVVIGANLLREAGGTTAAELLPAIVAGKVRIAFAALEASSRYALHDVGTTARRDGDHWVLDGAKQVVHAAPVATHLIVTARTAGGRRDEYGLSLFVVDRDADGVTAHDYRLIDDRSAADLTFTGVRLRRDALIGAQDAAYPLIEKVVDQAIAALCSEAVGVMRHMLEATVAYSKQRRQFGQPLSSFQVLQHRMVDMHMALELAVSAAHLATLKLDAERTTRAKAVSAAKVVISNAARLIGQGMVQLHGGMGMTDELAASHYFKRATVIESQWGTADHHVARYAALSRDAAA
jgi:alkylation response protein AidB-like acyl-CoA dehydrogenase